jgi:hypothetical protein
MGGATEEACIASGELKATASSAFPAAESRPEISVPLWLVVSCFVLCMFDFSS